MAIPNGYLMGTYTNTDANTNSLGGEPDWRKYPSSPPVPRQPDPTAQEVQRQEEYRRAMERSLPPFLGPESYRTIERILGREESSTPPKNTLVLIKKSIQQIKAEAVGEKAQKRIQTKIDRLRGAGALAQATILETELQVRVKLMRVGEWKYKVLPYDAIKQYEGANRNWDGQGGRYKVHIDLLENYCGTTTENETEAKDKIIPDGVLDELDVAKERQVFNKTHVLWVEKIKDPLLLGSIDGCKDFFLIAQWGDDVRFEDMVKGKK